jgi:ubiquinone/menaquinone biosynthesis C-methylase UbiE
MNLPFARMSFPEIYEEALVDPLFRPFARLILDDVLADTADSVLDIACGTGVVARLAEERLGEAAKVVGVDASPAMLAVARRVAPDIDWREADASDLPLHEGETFDVIVCQQGLQFFPDRPAAARQMKRALGPGGRLAVSTWRPDGEMAFLHELRRIAERRVGPIDDRRHGFGDARAIETLLREAGFGDVRSKTVSETVRFDDGAVFVRLNAMALVGMSAAAKGMGDEERQRVAAAIAEDSADVTASRADGEGLAFEISTNVVLASA